MDAIIQILVGIVIAAVTSLITVRLSREKFRSERWWEKKISAYERVIDAFHFDKKFSAEHLEAEDRELPKDREKELEKHAEQARDEMRRASDIGSFLLSPKALEILARYEADAAKLKGHTPLCGTGP